MRLVIRPIEESPAMGVEVCGLDPQMLDDAAVKRELWELWIDKGLIVFRGLSGAATQLGLSRCFGELQAHPVGRECKQEGPRELIRVQYDPQVRDVYEIDGRRLGGWLPWHFDLVYMSKVNHGGILRPVVLPRSGGETGFRDRIALYESLSSRLKDQIEHVSVVYKFDMNVERQKFGRPGSVKVVEWCDGVKDLLARQDGLFPAVVHPLVFQQPETGRRVLNFSPWFSVRAHEMDRQSGDALLHQLGDHCVSCPGAYFHSWRPDDMVLWDNWRMLHCAAGVAVDESRLMERTTILGDYGLGRLAPRTGDTP